ncbi:hypothetical protein TUBRATIS_005970 [Tubulinosema ratisbonensis]|uniref:Ricin B lectin domain-containing protein n=1 Tax=Tubulinosema ratisbonensis TaxID=291195 RepID=A0A437AP35_9MICR|nr:hypothetical protein TUBRATIS_29350 [Tubulinosema ratisbonensis]RVD92889.1 hypothetical protein TUBRATIS_005970 [Tubulinosema ratisbonensis]
MLIHFLIILSKIPVNKNIVISFIKDPQLHLVVYNNILRLKYIPPGTYKPSDPNVLKAVYIKDKYRLKFTDNSVYKSNSPVVKAESFDVRDTGFLFDIIETSLGFNIMTNDGDCLSKGELINPTEGNIVRAEGCDGSEDQVFLIKILENAYPGPDTQTTLGFKNKNLSDFANKEVRSHKNLLN